MFSQELSLSVVQRESAVDKANATLNLDTSVRVERQREVEEVQKKIEELEKVSVDTMQDTKTISGDPNDGTVSGVIMKLFNANPCFHVNIFIVYPLPLFIA